MGVNKAKFMKTTLLISPNRKKKRDASIIVSSMTSRMKLFNQNRPTKSLVSSVYAPQNSFKMLSKSNTPVSQLPMNDTKGFNFEFQNPGQRVTNFSSIQNKVSFLK